MVMATLNAGARTADTVVQVSVAGDTATVVEDFGAVGNFTITIPATQPSGQNTFSLTPVDDTIAEGDETLQVSGTATGLTVDGATLTLADDDTASTGIALTLDPQRVTEQGGQQTVMVMATLNAGARTADTVVQVSVAGDTATVVEDFAVVHGFEITIPATEARATGAFTVTPVDDTIAEGDETLQVSGTATGLTVDPATLTLADDDTASTGIALTLDPERVTEDGGQQTVMVTAMLDAGVRTADTVVNVTLAGLTATAVDDFQVVQGFPITIPATEISATGAFTVTPVDDTIAEGEETLTVSGTSPLPVTPATLTLRDDDTASTGIALTLDLERVTEQGGQQTVTVMATLNAGARTADTVVQVSVAGDTATVVEDFAVVHGFEITIPATEARATGAFTVTPVDDTIAEGDETLQVSGTATGLTVNPATLAIGDDDTASTGIVLTLDPTLLTEQGGQQTVTVTAMLNAGARTGDTVVNVSVAEASATEGTDFTAVGNFQITIPATQPSGQNTFSLTPVDDTIAEGEETLQVSGTATGLTVDRATLTLRDDDTASTGIALTLDPERVTEQGGQQTVTVMATLNAGARTADTVVQVSVAGDTATVVEDFAVVHGFEITIPATEARATGAFTVTPVDDTIAEGDETLQVSGTATGLTVNPATLAIGDDDTASTGIVLTLDPTLLTEQGGQQTVTVTAMLNAGARTGDTVVNVSVAEASATEGTDFTAVGNFQITIPATQPSGQNTFSLTPVDDTIAEGDETLQVSGTATGLTVDPATLTLADDDTASTGIALTLDPERVTEDGGQQTVMVTAMLDAGVRTADTVVNVTLAGLTATAVDDFQVVQGFPITIPATEISATGAFTVTPVDDTIAEGEETLTVSGASPLPVTPATLTLRDDDTASTGIALTLDLERVTEQGGQQTVTVMATLNAGARTADTVVQVSVAGDTATVVEDFAVVHGFEITIPATEARATGAFTVTPVDDTIAEGDETLQVSGTATGLTVNPATLAIGDDDTASTGIVLTLDPTLLTEQGGQQTVTVTAMLNAGARTGDTVVNVLVAGDTATAGDDFAPVPSFTITIPATQPSGQNTFTLTPVNDTIAEGEETLQVSGTATGLTVDRATLTLRDDDTASTGIALTLNPQRVTEQGGQQTVTVTAMLDAGARTGDTVVNVSVAEASATEGTDFTAVGNFQITIPATQPSGQNTFSLTPVNDTIAEGDETLQVSGTATGLTVDGATLTLADDDTASTGIALTLDPQRVTEQGGQQTVMVMATLNAGARTADTVVQVSVAGDTATVVEDFGAVGNFTITIPATQPSGQNTFSLTPVDDAIAEGEETLTVSGTSPLPVTPATLTLRDDDTASTGIALTLDPERVTEQGGQQTVTVMATLNAGARTADTVVNVTLAGLTATAVDDFQVVQGFPITIPATEISATGAFTVTPADDAIAEGEETLTVSGAATGLTVDPATLTLADNDTASTGIALTLDPERVTEQGGQQTVTVTATLNAGARTGDTVVNVSVAEASATEGTDFTAVGNFQITIPAGAGSGEADFTLTPVDDTIAEGDETLQVSGTATGLTVNPATLAIGDDDTASTGIVLTLDPTLLTEQGGQQTVTVTAMLNAGARTADTVVNVTVAGDTATVGDDFGAVSNFSVTIPATQPSGQNTFSLTPVDDAIAEGEETLTVSGTATGLTVDPATLTLADDDTASTGIALTLNPQRVTEQGGQQTVMVMATLNAGARTADTVVQVSVAGDTATVVEDFGAVGNFTITIPATQPSGQNTFSLTPVDDIIAEGDETLQVSGTSPLTVTAAELTLADDDTASTGIALTLDPERVTEDGGRQTVTVTAMLNAGARTGDTVVNVLVAEASATEGTDFTAVGNFQITIPVGAGSGEADFTLTPVNDTIAEGDETLQVSGTATGLTVDGATLTLADDDTASTGIALTLDLERVTEQGGQQTVTVMATLNAGARTADTVVQVSVAGDTATVVEDFGAVGNFTITIPAIQPSGQNTFSLTPVDDTIAEGDETLQVSGTSPLTVTAAELTLADDDTASTGIALTLDPERVTEDGGRQTVTVTAMLNAGARTGDTVVNVLVAGDTATAGDDFAPVPSFTITIPATQPSGQNTFSLTPVDNAIAEGEETLTVSGTSPLPVTPATLTLRDDDTASTGIALTLDPERVTEQGGQQTVTVMATLNAGARTADTVVNVTLAGLTATAVDDFQVVQGFPITIPATEISATGAFTVTPADDAIAEGEETLTVSGAATGLTVDPATLTLADNDTASTGIALTLDPERVTEQGGQQTVTVMATLNAGARTADTVVQVSVAGDTATVVEDFGAVGNFTITIPAIQPSGQNTFSLTPVDDTIAEGDETLQVSGTATGLTVDPATLTLGDDDTASTGIALTLDPERVTEQGGQQTVTVMATLNAGARTADTVVQVSVAGDTATVVEDFAVVHGFEITIPATEARATGAFTVTPVDDAIAEGEETLTVSGTATGLTVDPATLTLADDDTASTGIALTLDPERVTEDGGQQTVMVTAMLDAGVRTADTVVNVTLAGLTATAVDDFQVVQGFPITIPATEISATGAFTVTPVDDAIAEGEETLTVSGTAPLPVTPATLTLRDDDTASTGIALTLDLERVTEQGGQQTVTVMATLNAGARTADTVVNVLVAGDTATAGDDFAPVPSFTITIPANQASGQNTFSLTPVNDTIAEGEETLQVSGTATGLTVDRATLTLRDDDTASTGIALTLNPQRVTEQGGQQTVTVTAMLDAGARTGDTVVNVSVAEASATEGTDFTAVGNFQITIPATQPSGQNTFSLTPVNDTIAEGDETLQVSGTATGLTVDGATLTLADDDTASTGIALTLDPQRVTEQGGQQTVMVMATLNAGARTADTVVQVSVAGDTATVVEDFGAVGNFQITIPATQPSGQNTFSLTPVNDTIAEGDETLQVSGTATGLTVDGATLTLADDDTASTGIALTLDPQRVTEQGGQQTVMVMATLNAGARTADTVVQVSVAGDTATVVEDFGAVGNFTITIPATQPSGQNTFSLTPVDDTIAEGDETLQVSGTSPLTVTAAELTLADDDTASTGIALTLDPERVTEDGGQQTVTVTATLDAGTRTADTVVQVSVAGDTATVVEDFGAVGNFTITIPATQPSGQNTFSLTPVDDAIAEGEETLTVSGTATGLTVDPATLTLADDDTASTGIALTLDPERVTEDGGQQTVMVTAMLDAGVRTADTVVNVTLAGLTATAVDDFQVVQGFPITIPATEISATGAFTVTPADDAIAEGEETLTVSGAATGLTVDPATLTLADNDTASTGIALTLNPQRVTEQGGQQTVTVMATLNAGARTADTVVNVTVAGDTATVGDDFGAVSNFSVTIPATQPSGQNTFSLTPVDDAIAEGEETLTVSGTATGLTVDPATLTLADDDTASTGIALTLNPQRVTEQGGQQTVTVTAMLNAGARTADTVVDVTVAGNTATVVEDFGAVPSFSVTIPANQTSGQNTFSLTPVDDTIAEGDETLQVSGTATGLTVDPATLTLADDDTASTGIALTLDPERVTEDGGQQTVMVTAMLDAGVRTADTVVNVTLAGLTATAVDDFQVVQGFPITIPATEISATGAFTVTPVDDAIAEGEETLTVSGTAPLPVTPATLTLRDDDTASTGIALTLDPERVTEQGGRQTVTVTAMLNAGARTTDTVVNMTVAGDTATVVDDFAVVQGFQITIPATRTSGEAAFTLTPVNDTIAEGDETLTVSGTSALTVTPATLAIGDDDVPQIALRVTPMQISETGETSTAVSVAITNGVTFATSETIILALGGTASAGDDCVLTDAGGQTLAAPYVLTLPAGASSVTFTITAVNDTDDEDAETIIIKASHGSHGSKGSKGIGEQTITIIDNDEDRDEPPPALPQISIAAGTSPVIEGDPATFMLTRTEDATESLTVNVNVSETKDMISSSSEGTSQVTFPAGASDTTLTVPTVEDSVEEEASTITATVTGGGYNVGDPPSAMVIATDDDTRGVTLSKTALTVPEGGSSIYTVVLDSQPTAKEVTVKVTVPPGTDVSVPEDQASLTFTPSNWNEAQRVTVRAAHDPDAAIDPEVFLTHTVSGGDYQSVTAADVTVTITEDDPSSTTIALTPVTASGAEEGRAFDIEIRAALNAAARVTDTSVTVVVTGGTATSGTDYEAIGPLTITIPAEATQGAATLVVTPVNDDLAEGPETLVLTGTSPSGLEVTPATLTVTLLDDDTPEIALSVTQTQISEAGETSAEVLVAITNGSVFTEDKTVVLAVAETSTATRGDDYTLGGTEIIILAETATGKSTVTVTAVDDSIDEEDETLLITATLDGAAVGDAQTVTIGDDDTRGVTLSKTELTVREGETAKYTVALASEPAAAVTVAVTVPAGSGLSVDQARLTFKAKSWNTPQTVTVTAAMNAAAVMDGPVTLTHHVSGGDYESVTAESVTATVTGSDHPATRVKRINGVVLPRVAAEMADSTVSAISDRIEASRRGAQGTSSVPSLLALASRLLPFSADPHVQGAERRAVTLEQALAGTSFALPLNVFKDRGLGVWGSADYRSLSGRRGIAWNGDLSSFHLGADLRVRRDLLAGLAVARHIGAFNYAEQSGAEPVEGRYKSRMTGVHPYVAWFLPDGDRNLWATAGSGRGGIEIDDVVSGRHASDIRMMTGAVGGSGRLLSGNDLIAGGTTALRLKGEGTLMRIEAEGGGVIEPLTLDTRRLRLLLEGSHEKELASGGRLTPSLEVGVRHDGGDGSRGVGLEFGGELRYLDPELGLTLEARTRWLAAHRDDLGEWGVGGMILFEPGADKRGITFSLTSSWGETQSGTRQLWERGLTDAPVNENSLAYRPRGGVLDVELGYGLPVLSGRGLLTPYVRVSLGGGVSSGYGVVSSGCGGGSRGGRGTSGYGGVSPGYGGGLGYGGGSGYGAPVNGDGLSSYGGGSGSHRAGACFEVGESLDLNIEATRREGRDGADHGVMFRFRLEF